MHMFRKSNQEPNGLGVDSNQPKKHKVLAKSSKAKGKLILKAVEPDDRDSDEHDSEPANVFKWCANEMGRHFFLVRR